jgi:hypothetical protein
MDGPHKQEFHIRNLPTRAVTLFPTRAQVVREIKNVSLKVGHSTPEDSPAAAQTNRCI